MTRKNKPGLILPAENAGLEAYFHSPIVPGGLALTQGKRQQIGQELATQLAVIQGTAGKVVYGMRQIGRMEQAAMVQADENGRTIMAIGHLSDGQDHEKFMETLTERMLKNSGRHVIGAVEVGADAIAQEIYRELYPPEDEEPKRLGFWEWLAQR